MTIYAVQNGYDGKYWQAYADFLWYKNVKILGWMEDNGHRFIFSKSDLENYVKFLIKEESLPAVPIHKDIIYKPEAKVSKSSIQDDIEHIKQVAQESGINMESFNKIEEILNKTYEDEPPAKPMVSPPVVLSVDGAVVTYKKDGKTQSRSRRGFAKQYGEPVLSKPSPERAKKAGQKAKAR